MAKSKPNEKPVRLVSSVPTVVIDGQGIGVDVESATVQLVFFQLMSSGSNKKDTQEAPQGNIVSSLRLSFDQLVKLGKGIDEAIKEYEPKIKAKK